ncbi:pseudaminic acid cytidylyltransferase [Nitrincola tibetensis]|uniref:Pseudaminic acid cytidylyltransferase n=1 Tax=Nitrincola tibetensis TaxID=2219697 RepID=A0A364NIH4_9GAMM|nr:pseudaminic acid cytidylyltransferase [Nitrincola tibetensis]RAU16830.1 pseudaminic acid cytidylyltransferase [Nitrincola tibetensis]
MKVAIIPARGGSKRIPRKNIKDFCGKPMIVRSIEAALQSNCFDRVVVSTDDVEIAGVAKAYGAEVPFIRPAELSDDFTGTQPVIAHAVNSLQKETDNPIDLVCCIYATAPFVQSMYLQAGLEQLLQQRAEFAFSVTSYAFPIQRALKLTTAQGVEMFYPEHFHTRSQDLEEAWHDAGQFYWGTADAWLSGKPIFGNYSTPVVLPRHCVQDIDTPEDWERAEWLFKAMQATQGNP